MTFTRHVVGGPGSRARGCLLGKTQVPDDIDGETMKSAALLARCKRRRSEAVPEYREPGQVPGWTWYVDTDTGYLRPEPKPGYGGPLPQPVRMARHVSN
jgi:hypothetical protein